ncbi:MAG TPA: TlpA disulfide reductase family protein [Longimicrobiales bacterium]|nr:TlpA disulfide reductase family protein [Longimicrobiales bacterium]
MTRMTRPGRGREKERERRSVVRRTVDVVLWAAVLALLAWRFGPQVGAAFGLGRGSDPAPDFEVVTLDGETLRLSELKGKVVLVNFWATWCPPCRAEMPGFQRVWEDYRDDGLVIVGLSLDRGVRSDVERWVRQRGITYPVAFAPGAVARAYAGASTLPTSILIGPEGRIAHRVEGFYAEPALRAAVRRLLR